MLGSFPARPADCTAHEHGCASACDHSHHLRAAGASIVRVPPTARAPRACVSRPVGTWHRGRCWRPSWRVASSGNFPRFLRSAQHADARPHAGSRAAGPNPQEVVVNMGRQNLTPVSCSKNTPRRPRCSGASGAFWCGRLTAQPTSIAVRVPAITHIICEPLERRLYVYRPLHAPPAPA